MGKVVDLGNFKPVLEIKVPEQANSPLDYAAGFMSALNQMHEQLERAAIDVRDMANVTNCEHCKNYKERSKIVELAGRRVDIHPHYCKYWQASLNGGTDFCSHADPKETEVDKDKQG